MDPAWVDVFPFDSLGIASYISLLEGTWDPNLNLYYLPLESWNVSKIHGKLHRFTPHGQVERD